MKGVGAVIALVAGSVALLYVAGGAALTLRLFLIGLPSLNIVAQLPREVLISVALIQIVLPTVAVATLYALMRLLLGQTAPAPRRFVSAWDERSWRSWRAPVGASAVLALAATLFGVSPALARKEDWWRFAWVLMIVFVLDVVVMLVALKLRAEVAARATNGWNTLRSGASMTGVVALAALPACFLFAGTFRLLDAKVCTDHFARTGLLIGEMSDRIYLGESSERPWRRYKGDDALRVISIPQSQVEQLWIGGSLEDRGC